MPRLVLISDTHGMQNEMPQIPDGDILIHAGDLTRKGTIAELSSMTTFFSSLTHQHKVFIAGNHDFCFERDKVAASKQLPGTIYLQDKLIKVMGLKIYGSPWQPRFGDLAFNLDRGAEIAAMWGKIPDNIDVLVTHGPPFGIGDLTDINQNHVGCKDLLKAVKRIRPKLHVFGHIHSGYGLTIEDSTTFVNASICDEAYNPVNPSIVIDL